VSLYLTIILLGSVFKFLLMVCEKCVTGKEKDKIKSI
jgi:hypothetical protein